MVSQNTYQAKHLQYRHIEPPGAEKRMLEALSEGGLVPPLDFKNEWGRA